jgi:monoterpene epsilon-lactone hydrolase
MASKEHDLVVEMLKSLPNFDKLNWDIERDRAGYEMVAAAYPLDSEVIVTDKNINSIPVRFVKYPGCGEKGKILYLHGGGFCIGSLNTHSQLAAQISKQSDVEVCLVGYSLAPENPYPKALHEVIEVYKHLLNLTGSGKYLAVAGDSAGGGLTLSSLMYLRDNNIELPACAIVLSPWSDLTQGSNSMNEKRDDDPVVSKEALDADAEIYLMGHDPKDPYVSPVFGDFSGLCPLLIQVGTREVLLDDSKKVRDLAQQANVSVEYSEFEGCIHVFQQLAANSPEASTAIRQIGSFVKNHLEN